MRISEPEVLQRSWGSEQIVIWTPTHAGKILRRKAGTKGGFQFHVKEESHYVYVGELLIETVEHGKIKKTIVKDGNAWTVQPFELHRETALTDCILFEVSDPIRDDRYGLVPDALPNMTEEQAVEKLAELADVFQVRKLRCLRDASEVARHGLASMAPQVMPDA